MRQSISESQFRDAFRDYGREENFSYKGLGHLFNYLVDLEEDCGVEVELDVIAFCCEYSEYDSVDEVISNYDVDVSDCEDDHDREEAVKQYLYDRTSVVCFEDDCIIIADF